MPTRNEAGNVGPLVARLQPALADLDTEVLFVDDSSDDTPDTVRRVAAEIAAGPVGKVGFQVRVLHRAAGERTGGLGGAVAAGLRATAAHVVAVMDGDLQHPPEVVPELVAALRQRDHDVVVASRYSGAGSAAGLSSAFRGFVSSGSTLAARTLFPRVLGSVTDPMSGFFAVRRDAIDVAALQPRGFKILLEILARTGTLTASEIPFAFADRNDGKSKASWREGIRYLRQLLALRLSAHTGIGRFVRFGATGASGAVVNLVALAVLLATPLLGHLALRASADAIAATQIAIAWNFILTERFVFPGRPGHWGARLLPFFVLNNLALLVQLPLAARLAAVPGVSYVLATAVVILGLMAVRYVICDALLFRRRPARRASRLGSGRRAATVAVDSLPRQAA